MKVTYKGIEQFLRCMTFADSNIERISELPASANWQHACKEAGVSMLVPARCVYGGTEITYVLCPYCHKIIYYADIQEFNEGVYECQQI